MPVSEQWRAIIMASSAPSEARELELVGKVEMRIALAKDEKLESVLKVYLPPVLLKLGSEHQAVRNKVMIILSLLLGFTSFSNMPPINLCVGYCNLSAYQNQTLGKPVSVAEELLYSWLTSYRNVILPVAALLQQYKDNPESSMIRHFDLLFIQQSIGKLSSTVRHLYQPL